MKAVKRGNVITVSTLLWAAEQYGGEWYHDFLNCSDMFGNTALHVAARYNNATILRILLEEGCQVVCSNSRGNTPVHVACAYGNASCVEALLDSRVSSGPHRRQVPASQALVHDRIGEVHYIDAMNRGGLTALHLAALTCNHVVAAVLIARGAQLDCGVGRGLDRLPYLCGGSTPLHISASQGDIQTCMVLLEAQWGTQGLELRRMRNIVGLTPLNCALLAGHHGIVRILIDAPRRERLLTVNNIPEVHFSSSLRAHMLHVLHKAKLLVVLRDIALYWKHTGMSKDSDTRILDVFGVSNLSLKRIDKMKVLLENHEASLRDILFGFERTLHDSTNENRSLSHNDSEDIAGSKTNVACEKNTYIEDQWDQLTFQSRQSDSYPEDCPICMDSDIEVCFETCGHKVCFQCASALCLKPKDDIICPFCRQDVATLSILHSARTRACDIGRNCDGGNTDETEDVATAHHLLRAM